MNDMNDKELLQAKHRLEEAEARDRVKERKARTHRLIQDAPVRYLASHGVEVYLFEGPGQGGVVRVQGKKFTHEWERPVKAVLDAIGETNATIMGASLGGMLAPRAAAFDSRIKRVVGWSVFPNFLYTEVILGRDADEYTMAYHKCGLCGLGRQEGLFHLVKHMCVLDYMSVELMGGTLFRTQTLAQGGECCDFYVCRKGSEWEKEREAKDAQMQ